MVLILPYLRLDDEYIV